MSININSPEWGEIYKSLNTKLATLREQNDRPMSPEKTAFLRGQIRLIKELIDSPNTLEAAPAKKVAYDY